MSSSALASEARARFEKTTEEVQMKRRKREESPCSSRTRSRLSASARESILSDNISVPQMRKRCTRIVQRWLRSDKKL